MSRPDEATATSTPQKTLLQANAKSIKDEASQNTPNILGEQVPGLLTTFASVRTGLLGGAGQLNRAVLRVASVAIAGAASSRVHRRLLGAAMSTLSDTPNAC